ncbi:MAG: CoA-binding protein, partial [Candidatus Thorarchaeota archaeon]
MTHTKKLSISEILNIKSVAVVGVSPNFGYYWVYSMLQWEHDLKIWFVSRSGGEALGHRILANIEEIPEKIDYAIIRVPYNIVPEALRKCHKQGAK